MLFRRFRGGRRNEQYLVTGWFVVSFLHFEGERTMEKTEQLSQLEQYVGEDDVIETNTSKRNKGYDSADVRLMTERNATIDYKILLALYEHRALTALQLKIGWFPDLHENSIRNRVKTLAERRVLSVNLKHGIRARPIKLYSLTTLGLRIVVENILEVIEYIPQLDERKEHYTIDDLKVRGQHNHHHELQDWIMRILSHNPQLLHCEWRRFPFLEEESDTIRVKPDWLFVRTDQEIYDKIKEDVTYNPLLYPYLYRKSIFPDVRLQPFLCVECDRGTMNRHELIEKWESYKALPEQFMPGAIAAFYTAMKNGDMRHRLIRDTMFHAFELEVNNNEVQLFQGGPELTKEVTLLFYERDSNLLKGEEMTNESSLQYLTDEYMKVLEKGEISNLDINKTIERFKIPVKPDAIILKECDNNRSLQLIFYAMPGWVNPIIKIKSIKRWLKEGHLSIFQNIQFVLLYPDEGYFNDIRTTDDDVYYVSFKRIKAEGKWGKAHYELRKHKQVKWIEVSL